MEPVRHDLEGREIDPRLYLLQKEVLSLSEACTYLCISQSHMYKLTSGRVIPHYSPTGKLIYFKRTELDAWVLKHKRCDSDELAAKTDQFLSNRKHH
ncbi:helix-turn-helix domain-containing protein [Flaviaesturariibacter amylovorans]|uniref:Helix-turn-helix domain-containing protein n=1 Tax=Flaviaesturariibacter amylovorans TaxID=1084520 RepID=A0ABP8HHU2_9BACT